jgi:hypothetical protein
MYPNKKSKKHVKVRRKCPWLYIKQNINPPPLAPFFPFFTCAKILDEEKKKKKYPPHHSRAYIYLYFHFTKHSHTIRSLFPFHYIYLRLIDSSKFFYYHLFKITLNKYTCSVLFCYTLTPSGK